jgi:hypothetical protein
MVGSSPIRQRKWSPAREQGCRGRGNRCRVEVLPPRRRSRRLGREAWSAFVGEGREDQPTEGPRQRAEHWLVHLQEELSSRMWSRRAVCTKPIRRYNDRRLSQDRDLDCYLAEAGRNGAGKRARRSSAFSELERTCLKTASARESRVSTASM